MLLTQENTRRPDRMNGERYKCDLNCKWWPAIAHFAPGENLSIGLMVLNGTLYRHRKTDYILHNNSTHFKPFKIFNNCPGLFFVDGSYRYNSGFQAWFCVGMTAGSV